MDIPGSGAEADVNFGTADSLRGPAGVKADIRLCLPALVLMMWAPPVRTAAQLTTNKTRGQAEYERICGECHDLGVGTGNRRTRAQWAAVVDDMAAMGASGTKAELRLVVDYLSANFGK